MEHSSDLVRLERGGKSGKVHLRASANEVLCFQLSARGVPAVHLDGVEARVLRLLRAKCAGREIPEICAPAEGKEGGEFVVELFVPRGAEAGTLEGEVICGEERLPLSLEVLPLELPEESPVVCDLNSYAPSIARACGAEGEAARKAEQAYYRASFEHLALLHHLPYGQSGSVVAGLAPAREGGAEVFAWDEYDRRCGPLLDGTAFRGTWRRERPVEYYYLPVNFTWPADYAHWGRPGYERAFVKGLRKLFAHFHEKGWTRTRFELFFNHKKRYRYFPYDGDERRFAGDLGMFETYWRLLLRASDGMPVAVNPPPREGEGEVKVVYRTDISWTFGEDYDRPGVREMFGLWVASGGIGSWYPESVGAIHSRGQVLWHYGSAPGVSKPLADCAGLLLECFVRGADGFVCWNSVAGAEALKELSGDGATDLLFPGAKGPLVSLRLKAFRRGQQDLKYLQLVSEAGGRGKALDLVERAFKTKREEFWTPPPEMASRPPHEWTEGDWPKPRASFWEGAGEEAYVRLRRLCVEELL